MKLSDRLNILSQIINFALFLYIAIKSIAENNLNFLDLFILGYGLFAGLIVSIVGQIERIRGE